VYGAHSFSSHCGSGSRLRRHQVGDDESMTSLAEIIAPLDGLDSHADIFAETPWRSDTRAFMAERS
jgi:hypothetical protein